MMLCEKGRAGKARGVLALSRQLKHRVEEAPTGRETGFERDSLLSFSPAEWNHDVFIIIIMIIFSGRMQMVIELLHSCL